MKTLTMFIVLLIYFFPLIKSFRTVIGKIFLHSEVRARQSGKSAVKNTLFQRKRKIVHEAQLAICIARGNFAEKLSLITRPTGSEEHLYGNPI